MVGVSNDCLNPAFSPVAWLPMLGSQWERLCILGYLRPVKRKIGRMITKQYTLYSIYIEGNPMDRNPRKYDDEAEGVSSKVERHDDELTSSPVVMRRLEGVPGDWWTLESEAGDEYIAASADSWVELGR